ncbi:MAG: serine protease [Kiritimatiellae bacterium]|nr:serine protease [Kiritimatiellia bacterium]
MTNILQSVVKVDFASNFGTGFFIDDSGLLITSAHVIPNPPDQAAIYFANGGEAAAEFVSFAPGGADLALLRLIAPHKNSAFLQLAEPEDFRISRPVYTVGYPYPVYPALIGSGILGHHRASHGIIIFDAAVSSGSSGGPVLTRDGKVLGVISRQLMDRTSDAVYGGGFNSAVDTPSLRAFLEAVQRGETEVVRSAHLDYFRMPLPRLTVGERRRGRLSPTSDQLPEFLEYANGYQIDVSADMTYFITLESDDFDAYLLLYDGGSNLAGENDDAGVDTTNSAITYLADENERLTIVATSFARGEVGEYTLRVQEILFTSEEIIEHALTPESPRNDENKFYHDIPIEGQNRMLSVMMESDELDAYLELYDARGQMVDSNDDWRTGTTDARILTRTESGQTYRLRATTYSADETGEFTITVSWGDEAEAE